MQRLIAGRGVDARGARHVVDCLATLAPATGLEPRLLQTAALLLTTSDLVRGDTLARVCIFKFVIHTSLCFYTILFFISDTCSLLKTTRYSWWSSTCSWRYRKTIGITSFRKSYT